MTELRKYALLEEVAESIRIGNAQPGKKQPIKLFLETRHAMIAATCGSGVKPLWVRHSEEKPIRVRKGKEQNWSLAELRTALKACRELVPFLTIRAGKS
jgi:hypothetical protein